MLTKIQKIWAWVFVVLFLIPEILFSIVISSIINYSGKDFLTISSLFFDSRFFINNPTYFFISLFVQIISILGLLILSKSINKIVFSLLFIILFWLVFIFFLGYMSNTISLVF